MALTEGDGQRGLAGWKCKVSTCNPGTGDGRGIVPSGCSIRAVTTCSMRCMWIPAPGRGKACNPRSSICGLLWLQSGVAHRAITKSTVGASHGAVDHGLEGSRIELDLGLFTARAAAQCSNFEDCAVQHSDGSNHLGPGPGRHRGRAFTRIATSLTKCAP